MSVVFSELGVHGVVFFNNILERLVVDGIEDLLDAADLFGDVIGDIFVGFFAAALPVAEQGAVDPVKFVSDGGKFADGFLAFADKALELADIRSFKFIVTHRSRRPP